MVLGERSFLVFRRVADRGDFKDPDLEPSNPLVLQDPPTRKLSSGRVAAAFAGTSVIPGVNITQTYQKWRTNGGRKGGQPKFDFERIGRERKSRPSVILAKRQVTMSRGSKFTV